MVSYPVIFLVFDLDGVGRGLAEFHIFELFAEDFVF
jgi:hypothetical protein